jgi:hypothetical protein
MDPVEEAPFRPPAPAAVAPPPALPRLLFQVQRFLSFPPLLGTHTTWIAISTPQRQMSLRAITWLFSFLPPTTVTRWRSTDAPISRHFKLLILWLLFGPFLRSLLPLFGVVTCFSLRSGCLCSMPPLPLYLVVRRPLLVPLSPHNAMIRRLFSLTFLWCLRLKVLFGDTILLWLRLPLGLLLPPFLLSVLMHPPPSGLFCPP